MAFEGFTQGLTTLKNTLSNILNDILDAIGNLVVDLCNGLINLFVPKKDFFSEKFEEFKSHFAFIDTFTGFVSQFQNMRRKNEAPSISIDFSKAESQYNYGGKALALNLSWYTRYKPIADIVLTAFVYVFFIWRFYCRLPEIIRGAGISADYSSRISKEVNKK
jgi:hypothetical protein